jgi:D-beta-D-heptose 7-phosphate kinase/D-beta-D-heptose 1-phosphate adenosyltransferase
MGCDVFKPNAAEAKTITGETDWKKQCRIIKDIVKCKHVVITQSGNGVVGLSEDYFEYRPKTTIRNVASTIGAGDSFVAILSLALGCNMPIQEAIKYAFEAGAEYVKAKHNRPITPYELHRRIDPLHSKIMSKESIAVLREGVYSNLRWVWTNGVYDLIHAGHLKCLQEAKKLGDKLIVGINSDESVRRLKGYPRPIQPLLERQQVVAGLECVDFVVSFEEDTPYEIIKMLHPDVLVKGSHYTKEDISGNDLVKEVYLIDLVPGSSTTNIVERIKNSFADNK